MPQIQNGQVTPGQDGVPKLYGTEKVENSVPFQERLMRLFKPQEFVTIKNIDDEACFWQYMPAENETESFSEDGMQKMITRSDPEMWVIQPGETEVLVGANAYRALDVMYKAWTAKSTLRKFKDPSSPQFNEKNEHLPKNFNFADGGAQERFLELAYVGKAQPVFGPQVPAVDSAAQPMAMTSAPTQQNIAPMTAASQTPEYADPDKEAVSKAKELVNAGNNKK